MAAGDILTLKTSMAPRLMRCLYLTALILIAIGTILGLVRGVNIMTRTPPPRPAIAQNQAPAPAAPDAAPAAPDTAAAPQPPRPGIGPRRPGGPRPFMNRRLGPRPPMAPFGLARNPVGAGLWIIFGALLRGAIALMVVRILAEMGLAVLAMPRRSEI